MLLATAPFNAIGNATLNVGPTPPVFMGLPMLTQALVVDPTLGLAMAAACAAPETAVWTQSLQLVF